MEFVLVIAFIALVVWAGSRSQQKSKTARSAPTQQQPPVIRDQASVQKESELRTEIEQSVQRDFGRWTSSPELRRVDAKKSTDHVPPAPVGEGKEAWSPRTTQLEVAGEWYRAADLRKLFTKHAKVSESGAEIRLPAVLVPDAANPYDDKGVAVFVERLHVGYMERPDAARYHDAIAGLPGSQLVVTSRQWLRASGDDTWARVTVSVPPADQLQCPNPFGLDCVSLPPGSTIQVTKEEEHMEHLVPLLDRYGSETVVAARLRSITEQRPRSTVDLVAVDIDGEQVGVLSTTQTANFLPIVRRAESEGRHVYCRATLRGNSLKADVALHARKVHELDEDQLEKLFASSS